MKKNLFVIPETDVLEAKFEGLLCGSPDGTWDNSIKQGSTWGTSGDEDPYGLE